MSEFRNLSGWNQLTQLFLFDWLHWISLRDKHRRLFWISMSEFRELQWWNQQFYMYLWCCVHWFGLWNKYWWLFWKLLPEFRYKVSFFSGRGLVVVGDQNSWNGLRGANFIQGAKGGPKQRVILSERGANFLALSVRPQNLSKFFAWFSLNLLIISSVIPRCRSLHI